MASVNDYKPMLATLAQELPTGDDWVYEVKWDGYRALGYVRGGDARLVSRNGNDLTARFPNVAKALAKAARSPECVVDGEVCALDENGRPSFSAMQQGKASTPLVYELFDVLEVDGVPVVDLPLLERRERLEALIDKRQKTVQVSGFFDDGEALLEAAAEQGLEGVMAKRPASRYAEGKRTRDWLKVKTHGRQEFVICGWTKGQGRRAGRFGSLVLGTLSRQRAVLGRERRHRLQGAGHRRAAREARAAAHRHGAVQGDPEDAEGAQGRRRVGEAEARVRGRVRRVDA